MLVGCKSSIDNIEAHRHGGIIALRNQKYSKWKEQEIRNADKLWAFKMNQYYWICFKWVWRGKVFQEKELLASTKRVKKH